MNHGRQWLLSLWLGLAAAALFFYPLLAAADAQIILLSWRTQHTVELCAALMLYAAAAAAVVHWSQGGFRPAVLVLLAIAGVSFASFGFALLRLSPEKTGFAPWAAYAGVRLAVLVAGALIVLAVLMRPRLAAHAVRLALLAVSPMVLVCAGAIWRVAGTDPVKGGSTVVMRSAELQPPNNILVLLFDELSYSRLYSRDGTIDGRFPSLQRFGRSAVHYHAASAPGRETEISLPGYITGRRFQDTDAFKNMLQEVAPDGSRRQIDFDTPENLFRIAKAQGFRTELFGWYFPYCRLMPAALDACASYSLYNLKFRGTSCRFR